MYGYNIGYFVKHSCRKPNINFGIDRFYRKIVHNLTRFIYRPSYRGLDNIPNCGGAILISNHVSYVDGPLIDIGVYENCGRHVRYVIDEDIYNLPLINHLMRRAKAIPIAPNRKSVEAAFDAISEGLKAGDLICIFPEGYLTFTGGLGRFRHGIEFIIRRDSVPIIPISISGLWGSVFSRKFRGSWKRFIPRRFTQPVEVKCGAPISPDKADVNSLQAAVLRLKYS
ncbi:MAG: 1-acyl-sn-glycerol-3-phosphate acyltransferase [Rickettsiales bacterium]